MAGPVLFDFGGTLDADGRPWGERLFEGYQAAGGRLAEAPFLARCRVSDRLLAEIPEIARFGLRAMVERQVALLRGLLPDGADIAAAPWTGGFLADAHATAERNHPMLAELARTRPLGVVSNFTGNLRPCLEELGLLDCFELVLDSAVLGLRKPDGRLFSVAFRALDASPEACWMVGDNPFADIAPAARLGCSTCWIAPAGRALPDGPPPDRRIAALTELPAVLG
jgi:putative hydrolase of the HAD superfamily